MKKMTSPPNTTTYFQRHKNVVSSKNNTVKGAPNLVKQNLLSLESTIKTRYDAFETSLDNGNLFSFAQDSNLLQHKDDLLSCYTGRTQKVKEIFSLIENAQPVNFLKRCPYCGVTLPKTYDHYLPESLYPELSVHALNLIPCCNSCNQTKNNYWKNNSHRLFLHFYIDTIPDVQYLNVRLIANANMCAVGAIFSISRAPNIPNNVWDILSAHYEKLNLISIYNDLANNEISEVFNACVSHIRCGGFCVERFVTNLLSCDEQLYGINHWRVVLMKALSTNADFISAVRTSV
ncbi:hypothetical protein ORN63_000269 [Vibrio parahaemolyticus]|nr:hypothetical protein [Vibrio parahaemolyticus]EKD4045830.1 hypothetical protein [Vibrio parahaemolyticus]HAS6798407.1 HNH endonuclease [Vibrio parahaemolyticus]